MIISFQNTLFLKEFLACTDFFGLFTKIKKGSGTSVWCTISAWFFHKNVGYLTPHQWRFQHDTFFPSEDIKQNVWLSFYLDSWWHHKLEDLSWIKLSSNDWQGEKEGRKRGEGGKTQTWIPRERKQLFRWNKKHLS